MIRFKSIMSRVMFMHIIAVVMTAVFMPLVLFWFLKNTTDDLHHQAMREQADIIASYLKQAAGGGWTLELPRGVRDQYSEAYGRYTYAVLDNPEHVLFSSLRDGSAIFPIKDNAAAVRYLEVRRGDTLISGTSLRKEVNGQAVWFQVAENLAHRDVLIDDVVADFFQRVGWITVPMLLLLLATDVAIFRRAVQPLIRASRQAQDIGPTRIEVRLSIDDIPTEILPLVTAVNKALDRLEKGFYRQREFAADAAHELRTPLAILRTRLETLPDQPAVKGLIRDVEAMSRVISQLLDAAELDTLVVGPNEKADLRDICSEVAEFVAPIALAAGKSIAFSGPEAPMWVKGNPEMIRRAIRNLLENAIAHTPHGTAAEIELSDSGMVHVLDQGVGISTGEEELIFRRFWRRDVRRTTGAGLGLSIVKSIMEAHDGTITVENRSTGGAKFSMQFVPEGAR